MRPLLHLRHRTRAKRQSTSVARAVLTFALSGLLLLLLVGLVGVFILRRIGTDEATREAERLTAVAAHGIVEPRLTEGIVRGNAESLIKIDALVNGAVLRDPIVGVRIRDANGLILYADTPELIGSTFPLEADARRALVISGIAAGPADLSTEENRFEEREGPLLEVSLPIRTLKGHELLFQAHLRFDSVAASGRRLWTAFLPVLAVALVVLALLQVPLAVGLARRVHDSQRNSERLLRRAIASSDLERRRIAGDLHEGPVQELAGLSMSLSAAADSVGSTDPRAAESLREAAARARQAVRSLRSALMGISPPTLRRAGLRAALTDLVAPLTEDGVRVEIDAPATLDLSDDVESLLFRASQEAIRNVASHAAASHVRLRVSAKDGRVALEIEDNGVGFSPDRATNARADGHVGLALLDDLVQDADGTLDVDSSPGGGTRIRLQVPIR
jgi:two-component system, NarL family, sensor kinase